SHDRYLLDRLTDQLFIFTNSSEITIYNGNYSDYKTEQDELEKKTKSTGIKKEILVESNPVGIDKKPTISFKEKQELQALESEIPALEEKIKGMSETMNSISDHNRLIEISQEIEVLNKGLALKEERWLVLLEKEN